MLSILPRLLYPTRKRRRASRRAHTLEFRCPRLEWLEDRAMLSGKFDGAYAGSFSGTAEVTGYGPYPVSGGVSASVANSLVTVTAPGAGSGSVDFLGGGTFGAVAGYGINATFKGSFVLQGDFSVAASGSWSVPYFTLATAYGTFAGTASGGWSASRPSRPPDGTYYTGGTPGASAPHLPVVEPPSPVVGTEFGQYTNAQMKTYGELASAAYGFSPPAGWSVKKSWDTTLTGFQAALFVSDDGTQAVLAFRGTEPPEAMDWINNAAHFLGVLPAQYLEAQWIANQVKAEYGDKLTIVGHSLGGGMAQVAGLWTGTPTIAFNAAGMSYADVMALTTSGKMTPENQALITHVNTDNDVLTHWLKSMGSAALFGMPSNVGTTYTLQTNTSGISQSVTAHSMDTVVPAIEQGNILRSVEPLYVSVGNAVLPLLSGFWHSITPTPFAASRGGLAASAYDPSNDMQVATYDPSTGTFYLPGDGTTGDADVQIIHFDNIPTYFEPIAGDWDGTGTTKLGLYDPYSATFYLAHKNSADLTASDVTTISFGTSVVPSYFQPIVGDWNGDGTTTIGVYDPYNTNFYLANKNTAALDPMDDVCNVLFNVPNSPSASQPIVGNWGQNNEASVGAYVPGVQTLYYTDTAGVQSVQFANMTTGSAASSGVAGVGGVPGNAAGVPLLAAGGAVADGATTPLGANQLAPIVAEAIRRWDAAGLNTQQQARLALVQASVADLSGNQLGETLGTSIVVDGDAAGYGWFVDLMPGSDEEFTPAGGSQQTAVDPRAVDQVDLLTVVEHEIGHVLGLNDVAVNEGDLMSATLGPGVRRTPSAVDVVLANESG